MCHGWDISQPFLPEPVALKRASEECGGWITWFLPCSLAPWSSPQKLLTLECWQNFRQNQTSQNIVKGFWPLNSFFFFYFKQYDILLLFPYPFAVRMDRFVHITGCGAPMFTIDACWGSHEAVVHEHSALPSWRIQRRSQPSCWGTARNCVLCPGSQSFQDPAQHRPQHWGPTLGPLLARWAF